MPAAAPAAPARSFPTPSPGANTRPAISPMARNGTNTPPHPPAATAAVVADARKRATASNVTGRALALSAHRIAPPPGPTAAEGEAPIWRVTAVAPAANPPKASRTPGEADHFFAR